MLEARCNWVSAPDPSQSIYVSTASGMHTQHNSEPLASLEACFFCSETWADDPTITHALLRVIGFSGDVTVRLKATSFPRSEGFKQGIPKLVVA